VGFFPVSNNGIVQQYVTQICSIYFPSDHVFSTVNCPVVFYEESCKRAFDWNDGNHFIFVSFCTVQRGLGIIVVLQYKDGVFLVLGGEFSS
jgi:hypothetical protein